MTSLDVNVNVLEFGNESSVGAFGVNDASVPCDVSSVVTRPIGEASIPKDGTSVGSCGCGVGCAVGGTTVLSGGICEVPGETTTE